LLIQLGDIGDVILSLPCIETLRENYPEANIVVAVREKAGELMEGCKWIQCVVSIHKKKRPLLKAIAYQLSFFSQIRKYRFDLAIDLRTGTRGAFLAFFSGARQRVGFYADENLSRNWLFTHLVDTKNMPEKHMSDYYLSLLTSYRLKPAISKPRLEVSDEKKRQAFKLLRDNGVSMDKPIVAVHPFSLWDYKEWGIEKYKKVVNWITSKKRVAVVIIGSTDERERAAHIVSANRYNTFNVTGKTSLALLTGVLNYCSFFVGGDSAGMHLAAAVGVPTVSIFGPTSPESWAPRGDTHRVVQKSLSCVPCKEKGCRGTEESRCLIELSADEVIAAIERHPGWIPIFGNTD
jgi:heptosyltransferase-3